MPWPAHRPGFPSHLPIKVSINPALGALGGLFKAWDLSHIAVETIENHLAKLWGDLMFYRENAFFPPPFLFQLAGRKAGALQAPSGWYPRLHLTLSLACLRSPRREEARLPGWLGLPRRPWKQIRPYLPGSPDCLSPLRGAAVATGACGEAHIWRPGGMRALAGGLEKNGRVLVNSASYK